MRIVGAALLGLFGGWVVGFAVSALVHIPMGLLGVSDATPWVVAVGLLPYLLAVVGLVAVPIIVVRRGREDPEGEG
ncbi:DUF5957 family protein [Nocardiopsis suaedae]|uniref:DUF5957 family protein n=1 Tax=Nocardiopsis suaedae TaxID=3018444 RepID=A0ABT4TE20_9ACTN|nr:DUF5957 family protein [Nocardiopsis suaedae]MDA2802890.1 DUF5957 family protein [Nocardiopsis suaedae]